MGRVLNILVWEMKGTPKYVWYGSHSLVDFRNRINYVIILYTRKRLGSPRSLPILVSGWDH